MLRQIKETFFDTDKLLVDSRESIYTFNGPREESYGIFLPNLSFYVQAFFLFIIQVSISGALSVLVYKYVIVPQFSGRASSTAYIVGFGIVIPIVLNTPFWLMEYFNIEARTLRMVLIMLPTTTSLKILEAMYGFTPPPAKKSFSNFCLYFTCLTSPIMFDPSTSRAIKSSSEFLLSRTKEFISTTLALAIMFSILRPYDFAPFETRESAHSMDHSISDIFQPGHLMNNFSTALLTSLALSQSTTGFSLIYNTVYGVQTKRVVENPMLQSSSPSNFWGRRWNMLIHEALKRGVFKPMIKYFSRSTAVAATFLASGALHEYVWAIVFYITAGQKDENGDCSSCVIPLHGKNMIFFGWNGVVIILESIVGSWWFFQWTSKKLPSAVKTALVIMTALPVGHLFTGDWILGGFYHQWSLIVPMIAPLKK